MPALQPVRGTRDIMAEDGRRFRRIVEDMLSHALGGSQRVRAFGEMVALLWQRGQHAATLRLEQLWHDLCQEKKFSLFCAYPMDLFGGNGEGMIARRELCACHSHEIEAKMG